jgi:hypothetical protein
MTNRSLTVVVAGLLQGKIFNINLIALSVLQCDKILQTVNHVAKYVAFWFEVDIQIAAAKKRRLMLKILP